MGLPLWGQSVQRQVQTSIKCHNCQHALTAHRACQEVLLQCAACGKTFPLKEYVREMDAALEHFMEEIACNRI